MSRKRAFAVPVILVALWSFHPTGSASQGEADGPKTTRALLGASGGAMTGQGPLRLGSTSLGSVIQTGLTTGDYQLISGFVQEPHVPGGNPTGDFNQDGEVNFDDFFLFAGAFGSDNRAFDLNRDGRVDFDDFFLFAAHFGEKKAR